MRMKNSIRFTVLAGAVSFYGGLCAVGGNLPSPGPLPGASIARLWNEQNLAAIRVDTPHPPVHARNLFHLSVAMYDAWAAYDPVARGYVYQQKHLRGGETEEMIAAARREAISYAAYRLVRERYALSKSAAKTLAAFDAQMVSLGYRTNNLFTHISAAARVGDGVYSAVSAYFENDGCNQKQAYADLPRERGGYSPINPVLVSGVGGITVADPNHWQPLAIANAVDQNGFPASPLQQFLGSQWLGVMPFALRREHEALPWIDPGEPPQLGGRGDAQFKEDVVEVIRKSSELTPDDGVVLDVSPAAFGNNSLGRNDGAGRALNPITGLPYKSNRVKRGDFARVLAEFWADGPNSETPPGHWNVIANLAADQPQFDRRLGGSGRILDRLEWDVKIYFALNAALHDAACAAWSLKRYYDGGRPISFIRYMGMRGQCTDSKQPSYHPSGLPLVEGLIELVTAESTKKGGCHQRLPVGQVVLHTWPGQPADATNQHSGVRWILAKDWIPYQKSNFVTPSFPGYISGHSTFSRAAAEVLTLATGSPFFPNGLGSHRVPANKFLTFEKGPTEDIQLQWATYYDAADQAGLSRIWGGIHVSADDLTGRRVGAKVGLAAWSAALNYFEGKIQSRPANL